MASLHLGDDDDDDENDSVVPQRLNQVSQEHEDLVVKGDQKLFLWAHILSCLCEQFITTREEKSTCISTTLTSRLHVNGK